MNCQNCKHWVFGKCIIQNAAMGKDSLCNAWELSLSWEQVAETPPATDRTAELQARIAELEEALRWIPITERLPEKDTPVHTISENNVNPVTAVYDNGFWYSSVDWALYVTHWMPISELPKEREP